MNVCVFVSLYVYVCVKPAGTNVKWRKDDSHKTGWQAMLSGDCLGGERTLLVCILLTHSLHTYCIGKKSFKKFLRAACLQEGMAKPGDSRHEKKVKNEAIR